MKLTKQMVKYDFYYDKLLEMETGKRRKYVTDTDPLLNGQFGSDADFFINEAKKIQEFESHSYADS